MPPFVRDEQPSGWFDEYPELQEILNMQMMHPVQPLQPMQPLHPMLPLPLIELQLAQAQAEAQAQLAVNNDVDFNMETIELIATVSHMLEERERLRATLAAIQARLRRTAHLEAVQELINIRDELGEQPEQTEEVVRQLSLYDEQIITMLNEYDQMD